MEQWSNHAVRHAETTSHRHVRPDGSTFHLVDFDPATGAILSQETVQGDQDGSTWARGQAWGLDGFVMACREVDVSLIYDDSDFIEALVRYLALTPPPAVPSASPGGVVVLAILLLGAALWRLPRAGPR